MKHDPVLSAVDCTLSTYLLMNRHSEDETQIARTTLKLHFDQLIDHGEADQQRLVVKGLTLLRELDERKASLQHLALAAGRQRKYPSMQI